MSNKKRIAELEDIVANMNPKSTLKYRLELGRLRADEPEKPATVAKATVSKKPRKSKTK